jgi:hypothetical protein
MTTGKWATPDVPHRGWTCCGVEDLGDIDAVCEMCEVQPIRYVHDMEHPGYPDVLRVGCVCAENMEGDYIGPRRRERAIRNAAARRRKWPFRKGWRMSRKGNPFIRANGFVVTAYPSNGAWRFWLQCPSEERSWPSKYDYPSEDAAKLAAFDAIVWLESRAQR